MIHMCCCNPVSVPKAGSSSSSSYCCTQLPPFRSANTLASTLDSPQKNQNDAEANSNSSTILHSAELRSTGHSRQLKCGRSDQTTPHQLHSSVSHRLP